ncbi:MAG: anti-sigma factor family protein [Planctomycetota bacterium]
MTEQNDPKFDCTDIKAMLSALIDDEAEASDRYRAERHLADCKACRELLSDAERNDALVATAVAGPQPGGLPAGFEAAVLRRVTEGDQPGAARRWSAWLGWFAAAAVILLGAALWWLDRPRVMNSPVATTVGGAGLVGRERVATQDPGAACAAGAHPGRCRGAGGRVTAAGDAAAERRRRLCPRRARPRGH